MINGRTYYDILDLPKYGINDYGERISYDKIERAYNKLRYGISNGEGRVSIEEMRQINEAFRVLSRQETRNEYDKQLRNNEYITNEQVVQEDMLIEENEEVIEEVETPIVTPKQEEIEEPEQEIPDKEEIEESEQEEPDKEEVTEEVVTPIVTQEHEEEKKENIEEIEENLNKEIDKELEKEQEEAEKKAKLEAEKKEQELKELDSVDPNYEKRKENRKRILKNIGIIGASAIVGPIGIITSSIILAKKGKFKLQKIDKPKIIKEIKTQETKIIEEESTKLENEIDFLLSKPLTNTQDTYRLEIAKLKYKNQIDLLRQRIDFKENEIDKLGTKVSNRLKKLALKMRLEAASKWLELREAKAKAKLAKLNEYKPNSKQNDELSKLNKEIQGIKDEILSGNLNDSEKYRKKLKLQKLNQKRLDKVNKLKSQRCGISRNQVVLAVFDSVKNKFFNSSSTPIDGEYVEIDDNIKTR